MRRLVRNALLAAGCMVVASETAQWIAGTEPHHGGVGGGCAVLVLGSPADEDGRATDVQRSRVEAGTRAARENGCDLLVISGGSAYNRYQEADVMGALVPTGSPFRIVRETESTNTWENIRRSLPLLQGHPRILIASDALHAQRGRRYLCRQRPDLCSSAGIAPTRMPWQRMPYRLGSSFYELRAWIRDVLFY